MFEQSYPWRRAAFAGLVLLLAAASAQAQVYRCGNGKYSNTPCAGTRYNEQMGSAGPVGDNGDPQQTRTSSYKRASPSQDYYQSPTRIREAPDYYAYLSPACKQLNDALRTSATRGVRGDALADLQREWDQRCEENAVEAWRAMREAKQDASDHRRADAAAAQARQDDADAQRERCDEMLRILSRKRKRTDLTAGEQAELARFEQNYQQRCR